MTVGATSACWTPPASRTRRAAGSAPTPEPKEVLEKRTLLVTGASSGIGASLLRKLAGRYDEVIAAARRVDRMRAGYADLPSVTPVRLDVSDPDELTAFARGLLAEHGLVPYVISCAGA